MKVVIDTNVVVSAALKDKGPEQVLQFIVGRPDFEWVVSSAILAEYKEVLTREKFGLPPEVRQKWEHFLDTVTTLIDVPTTRSCISSCRLIRDCESLMSAKAFLMKR